MDFLGTKAMVIGTAIFITLAITTAILVTFNQVTKIYQKVYKTDVGIKEEFNEFAMYQDTNMSGLEVYNAVKKFKNNVYVTIYIYNEIINKEEYVSKFDINNMEYNKRIYDVSYIDNGDDTFDIFFK